jgi:hypothetical protein
MEYVYVLTNEAMPGIVKIGRTAQDDVRSRIDQLYTTGVPVPFKLEFACRVENSSEIEQALHRAFSPYRVNPKREFFRIDAEQAIVILKLLHVEDTTSAIENQASIVDAISLNAAEQLRKKRPPLNFDEMGIPVGSELKFNKTDISIIVSGSRKITLADEEMSLTNATKLMLGTAHSVAPAPYWTYEGKSLSEIYDETYGSRYPEIE